MDAALDGFEFASPVRLRNSKFNPSTISDDNSRGPPDPPAVVVMMFRG
jgi:hypothetical protein